MEPKKYTRKEAKKLMKDYKLKWFWNKSLEEGDIQCFCGVLFSNPIHGYVISYPLYENIDPGHFVNDPKFPVGRPLFRVPDQHPTKWWWRTYFNKEEYEEFIKDKVTVSGERHLTFDELWEKYTYPKTNLDIIEMKNGKIGHVYRSITPNEDALYGHYKGLITDEEFKKFDDIKAAEYEKVISLGMYTTPNPDLMQCPICEIVNSLGYWRTCIPLRYRIREILKFKCKLGYKFLFPNKEISIKCSSAGENNEN